MSATDGPDRIYAGSDGAFYSGWEVDRRLRVGRWRRCLVDRARELALVETRRETLVLLVPIQASRLPEWVDPMSTAGAAVWLVDGRRTRPPGSAGRSSCRDG